MDVRTSPLLTDLYQLNMLEAYLAAGEVKPAIFEFFVCRLPGRRGFLMAAGLEQALDYLETSYLRERAFRRVFLAGLAFDFCVASPPRTPAAADSTWS